MWQVTEYDDFVDVTPVDDTKEHGTGNECWCSPRLVRDSDALPITVHNAADNREQAEALIEVGRSGKIHNTFKGNAKLVIVKPNYAYIEVGTMRYYFCGEPEYKEVELFGGDKVTETLLPYDGWELLGSKDNG